ATVVGVLVEVPVMLLLVGVVNRSRSWFENPMPQTVRQY
ncbi:MAG: arsenical-resistance protein, partial [Candidatus Competibacteraceae bacterium]|nr:arsenical-resistance protein [Candidatus Competibacteraceae bacterium]